TAKFDRKPSDRCSSGLIPSDRRWASSRAATSDWLDGPDTVASLFHRERRATGFASRTCSGNTETLGKSSGPRPERAAEHRSGRNRNQGRITARATDFAVPGPREREFRRGG